MDNIISGKTLSKEIREELKRRASELIQTVGITPKLTVVLVGNDPASISYVTAKERGCKEIGIDGEIIRMPETTTEEELLMQIEKLNNDDAVHGILVQLPLPKHIDEDKVIEAVSYVKDVDGFHPMNVANLHIGKECILPCTPKGILVMLKNKGIEISGKNAVVVGRSNLVGKPVAQLLLKEHATVTICHSRTTDLKAHTLRADILIAAVGRPKLITSDMVKEGAVVIDVGVNRVDGKLCGDVDFESIKEKAKWITPVPGGVGPMTIAMLLENTLECFRMTHKKA